MVEFSQIDKDLNIYRRNKVFLWGAGGRGSQVKHILGTFGISIEAFVDSNNEKCGEKYFGKPIISFNDFVERASGDISCIVQISCDDEYEIIQRLEQHKIQYISYSEFHSRTEALGKYILWKNGQLNNVVGDYVERVNRLGFERELTSYLAWNIKSNAKTCNFLFSIPSVGNTSLGYSYNAGVALTVPHSLSFINNEVMDYILKQEINILCGVRDIISQRLSICYQMMGSGSCWDLEENWHGGGDVEEIFNRYFIKPIDKECECSLHMKKMGYDYGGPEFFEKQIKEHLNIDVYDYSFDKEAGYTIIHKDNIHIMIYQMEKMDKLESQISNFFGCGDEVKIQKHNDAANKWYNDSYKKAKKEIKFDREYFLECYEGKYMKHFYNAEDIERFKQKWIGNVRN